MKQTLLFFLLLLHTLGYGQQAQLSSQAEISIITVGSGKNLNDTWGHCAIRVLDQENKIDQVYNYGMYDYKTPNFYIKFMRGQLPYDLANYPFHYFLEGYSQENRGVDEQILQLNQSQKQQYFDFLQNNAKPENKSYLYDFFFDNCATKLRDVNTEILGKTVNYNDEILQDDFTFRDLIYQKLDYHPWSKFGIDLALGSIIDKKATPKQYTFLPEYTSKSFQGAVLTYSEKKIPLVKQTRILYQQKEEKVKLSYFTPMFLFSLLAILVIGITYNDYKKKKRTKIVDFLLFFSTGLTGILVLLLWFATDHKATVDNYNVFWVVAPNVVVAFILLRNDLAKWLKKYIALLIGLLVLTIILWLLKIQIFSLGIIPILILLFMRYSFLLLHRETRSSTEVHKGLSI